MRSLPYAANSTGVRDGACLALSITSVTMPEPLTERIRGLLLAVCAIAEGRRVSNDARIKTLKRSEFAVLINLGVLKANA